jgi:hypothetical protein
MTASRWSEARPPREGASLRRHRDVVGRIGAASRRVSATDGLLATFAVRGRTKVVAVECDDHEPRGSLESGSVSVLNFEVVGPRIDLCGEAGPVRIAGALRDHERVGLPVAAPVGGTFSLCQP